MKQSTALKVLRSGHNVFLTGAAGSGKTHVLNEFIRSARSQGQIVAVTASTGIASTHLNGQTIHSWSGIGIRDSLSSSDLRKILRSRKVRSRVVKTDVLVIDEISMLPSRQFSMVDEVCRAGRKDKRPFGGLQLVVCGDFFQLPPISGQGTTTEYVYGSATWAQADLRVCYLTEQHRQRRGQLFTALTDIRDGRVTDATRSIISSRIDIQPPSDRIIPRLSTHNVQVDALNEAKLIDLAGPASTFEMISSGDATSAARLMKGCLAPERLVLKIGAAVMFVKNNEQDGYVNGTLGTVTEFNQAGWPVVETLDGRTIEASPQTWKVEEDERAIASIIQVPLRLAWAITIHKSQGMTMDAALINLSKAFTFGMGYVALSRVRSLDGVFLEGINQTALLVHPEVLAKDKEFLAASAVVEHST